MTKDKRFMKKLYIKMVFIISYIVIFSVLIIIQSTGFGTTVEIEAGMKSSFISFEDLGILNGDHVVINFIANDMNDTQVFFITKEEYETSADVIVNNTSLSMSLIIKNENIQEVFVIPIDNSDWGFFIYNSHDIKQSLRYQIREPAISLPESAILGDILFFLFFLFLIIITLPTIGEEKYTHLIWPPAIMSAIFTLLIFRRILRYGNISDFIALYGIIFTTIFLINKEIKENKPKDVRRKLVKKIKRRK